MAYDANDPADKAIVDALIKAAVKAALEEKQAEHESEIEGLIAKRDELLGKLRKARLGEGGGDSAEVERLENEVTELQGKLRKAESDLRQANRDLETVTGERDTARTELGAERETSRAEFATNRLTSELTGVNVGSQFLEDLCGSMAPKVTVKEVDGKREAFVGDKSLSDYIKEWAGSDKGKHYVTAAANGGGGSQAPGNPSGGAKKIAEMTLKERTDHFNAVGKEAFEKQVADEKAAA